MERRTRWDVILGTVLRDPFSGTVLGCITLIWCASLIAKAVFWWSDITPVATDGTPNQFTELVLALFALTIGALGWATVRAFWIQRVLRQGKRVSAGVDAIFSDGIVLFRLDYRWGSRSFRRQGWALPLPYAAFIERDARTEIAFLEDRPERPVIVGLFDENSGQ